MKSERTQKKAQPMPQMGAPNGAHWQYNQWAPNWDANTAFVPDFYAPQSVMAAVIGVYSPQKPNVRNALDSDMLSSMNLYNYNFVQDSAKFTNTQLVQYNSTIAPPVNIQGTSARAQLYSRIKALLGTLPGSS